MKIVIVEGAFEGFEDGPFPPRVQCQWLGDIRRKHGRVHVALWPTDAKVWQERANRLKQLPSVWGVHPCKARELLPWLEQENPDAHIKVIAKPSEIFEV